jgi:hypothetical protein
VYTDHIKARSLGTKETAMKNQTGLSVIEKAQQMCEQYGIEEAIEIAGHFASNSSVSSARFFYWMVVKALKEVKADME